MKKNISESEQTALKLEREREIEREKKREGNREGGLERERNRKRKRRRKRQREIKRERVSRKCEASVHEVNGLRDSEIIKIE